MQQRQGWKQTEFRNYDIFLTVRKGFKGYRCETQLILNLPYPKFKMVSRIVFEELKEQYTDRSRRVRVQISSGSPVTPQVFEIKGSVYK